MNLEDLDGVTVAYDYAKALTEIDRGYETSHVLTASTEIAHGVAMALLFLCKGLAFRCNTQQQRQR